LLADKVILVTGAGSGIGRRAALAYAAHHATVILLGRTLGKLEQVYDEIRATGGCAVIQPFDLANNNPADYQQLANAIEQQFQRLDGLLHNAGLLGPLTPLEQYPLSQWQQLLTVNLTGPLLLTQALLPALKQAANGSIIFTSSSKGRTASAYWGGYSATKFATEAMMKTLAEELENTSAIRVNAINPGATRTSMRAQAYPAENPNQCASPDQIMPLYLYLMGQDSLLVNGQSLNAQLRVNSS
jgi:NAD(P)-dependent dehydrogenase (short-subunit alcohol dehydrogenase family)